MRLMIAAVILLVLAACSQAGSPVENAALANPVTLPTAVGAVMDAASLTDALRAHGANVTPDGQVALAFLRGSGTLLRVDDQRVQVYEYPAADAARQDAARFSQDGAWVNGDLGTLLVNWFDTPYLYQASRLIAVYVGDSTSTLTLLQNVLGAPFAGGANPYRAAVAMRSAD